MEKKNTLFLAAAFAAATSFAGNADAAKEKCYGAALAGENGCGDKLGKHSCAGYATTNCDENEWLLVEEGTCTDAVASCKARAKAKAKK